MMPMTMIVTLESRQADEEEDRSQVYGDSEYKKPEMIVSIHLHGRPRIKYI